MPWSVDRSRSSATGVDMDTRRMMGYIRDWGYARIAAVRARFLFGRYAEAAAMLPGGLVRQKHNGCFLACMSMMTGIDYDLFELYPIAIWVGSSDEDNYVHISPTRAEEWQRLLEDNGFRMAIDSEEDAFPRVLAIYDTEDEDAHAIIDLGNGYIVDPYNAEVMDKRYYRGWLTAYTVNIQEI